MSGEDDSGGLLNDEFSYKLGRRSSKQIDRTDRVFQYIKVEI